jgi:glycosyltransferase involved in cell wall biosynthesis
VFIGDGAEKENLLRFAADRGLENVTFLPPQPKADIPSWLSASDVALVSLLDLPVFETVLPSKMFEIMACGRPVALIGKGESQRLLAKAEAGIVIDPGDPEKLAESILALKENPDLREKLGSNGREYVLEHFDRERLAERYLAKLEELRET